MNEWKMTTKVDKLIFSFVQEDKVIVIGSRKVHTLDLSMDFDELDITAFGSPERVYIPGSPEYSLACRMRGFTQVVGSTYEEALFNLILAFREEERKEEEIREAARIANENWTRSPSASGSIGYRCSDPECSCEEDDWDYYDRDYDDEIYDDTIYDDYDEYDSDSDCDCEWCR